MINTFDTWIHFWVKVDYLHVIKVYVGGKKSILRFIMSLSLDYYVLEVQIGLHLLFTTYYSTGGATVTSHKC